jgi:ATP adenylyltransferase
MTYREALTLNDNPPDYWLVYDDDGGFLGVHEYVPGKPLNGGAETWEPVYSGRTAISRRGPSAPMRWIYENGGVQDEGLMWGPWLDYGCGRGDDARYYDMDMYDPHFYPDWPTPGYAVVVCIYVLNVIPCPEVRASVVARVKSLLSPWGVAFFAVRNDKRNLNGLTAQGTWQGYVEVPEGDLIHEESGFRIYRVDSR